MNSISDLIGLLVALLCISVILTTLMVVFPLPTIYADPAVVDCVCVPLE